MTKLEEDPATWEARRCQQFHSQCLTVILLFVQVFSLSHGPAAALLHLLHSLATASVVRSVAQGEAAASPPEAQKLSLQTPGAAHVDAAPQIAALTKENLQRVGKEVGEHRSAPVVEAGGTTSSNSTLIFLITIAMRSFAILHSRGC